MKYCSQCGHANEDDALFCVKDGCKLGEPIDGIQEDKSKKQICTKCGFENESNIKFCGGCGKPLDVNVQTKKAKRVSFSKFVIVVSFIIVMIVGFFLAKNTYDNDFSELFDDFIELFEAEEKEYYINVNMHHSSEIDMDGETINFSVDTNIESFDMNKLDFSVSGVAWKRANHEGFYEPSAKSVWAKYAKDPIINVEIVNDKNFKITIDRNRGFRRCFTIWVTASESIFDRIYFEQDGYKIWEDNGY